MASRNTKRADKYIPYCEDQGIQYLTGASRAGIAVHSAQTPMPVDGVIDFAAVGLPAMRAGQYQVFIHNHTSANQGTVQPAARGSDSMTVVGPIEDDILDIMLIGPTALQVV